MMERQSDRPQRRPWLYVVVFALLVAVGLTAESWGWTGNTELHTVQEVLATSAALFAGAMSLVRHHTKRQRSFLLLGGGMIGAGILDGYHAAVTSSFLSGYFSHSVGGLAAWSALVSRVYLSVLVCASCVASGDDRNEEHPFRCQDKAVYWLMAGTLVVSLLSFGWIRISPPTLPHFAIHRPAELLPALLFAVAAVVLLVKGHWRTERFPHWMLLSVVIATVGHSTCMAFSAVPGDALHVAGHLYRILSFLLIVTGLLIDMYSIFRREAENAERLLHANGLLAAEITERQQAEESLLRTQNELEARVIERTSDLVGANRALEEEIAERRWAESELCLQEERFRLAALNASDVIWEWDIRDDKLLLWSEPGNALNLDRAVFPLSMAEFQKMVHPDDRAPIADAIRRFIETGEDFRQDYRIIAPNGETLHRASRGTAIRDAEGRPLRCIGVTSDITERKRSEAAFVHMAAIVESSLAAIVSKSLDGTVLTWNAAAERMFGYTADEVRGRVTALVPPELEVEEAQLLRKIALGESVEHMETVRIRKDGASINVVLAVSPIRDSSGHITGGSWVVWDTTERKLLERQLAQAQKLESIGQLAAGVAHEINTPIQYIGDNIRFFEESFQQLDPLLAAMPGLLPVLRGDQAPEGMADEIEALVEQADVEYLRHEIPLSITQSLEGVEHVSRIVGAMKEFSHPGPLEKRAVDLNRAIESTVQVSRNEWKYVASLDTDLDRSLPLVPCIQGEFNQVVLNLIINAAHAIGDRLKALPGAPGRITVSTRRNGEWAEIRVRDTGTGIPEAVQAKIFDPFFTTKPVGQGTGQGLAIAHSVVVQKHGGKISFETEQGAGTTFLVQLPLEQAA